MLGIKQLATDTTCILNHLVSTMKHSKTVLKPQYSTTKYKHTKTKENNMSSNLEKHVPVP